MKSKVFAGYNVTCVGDDRAYSYVPSRNGQTISDLIAKHVLKWTDEKFIKYSWLDRGSDERPRGRNPPRQSTRFCFRLPKAFQSCFARRYAAFLWWFGRLFWIRHRAPHREKTRTHVSARRFGHA